LAELLNKLQKNKLLRLARETIEFYLERRKELDIQENDPVLNQNMGAFVTLHAKDRLRGCIGNIMGRQPLYLTIRDMSIAAAFEDPRFNPVTKQEIKDINIEISVLSPLKKITNPDEIVLGEHGVLVKNDFTSGVYLPQVATETGWDKERFMNSLCGDKAGMKLDAWRTGACEIYVFSAVVFKED
jgi:AmmeMemoRadiSam system protein A